MYLHQTRNYFDGDEEHGFDGVEMERIVASEILERHARDISKDSAIDYIFYSYIITDLFWNRNYLFPWSVWGMNTGIQ